MCTWVTTPGCGCARLGFRRVTLGASPEVVTFAVDEQMRSLWPDTASGPTSSTARGAQDAKRGKLFTKLIREVTVATKLAGPDPSGNPRLRTPWTRRLRATSQRTTSSAPSNAPRATRTRTIIEEVRYEGYGPAGVAVIVDCMTDNRNRTVSEVRHAFSKCGGNLGTDGSVAYLFEHVGQISYGTDIDEDRLMEAAIEAGAEDIRTTTTAPSTCLPASTSFSAVRDRLKTLEMEPENAEVTMRPSTNVTLALEEAKRMVRLLDMLEDADDVQQVYSNADISEEILAQLD